MIAKPPRNPSGSNMGSNKNPSELNVSGMGTDRQANPSQQSLPNLLANKSNIS